MGGLVNTRCSSCGGKSSACGGPSRCVKSKLGEIQDGTLVPIDAGGSLAGTLDPCPECPDDNIGNKPISDEEYRCSLAVSLQPHIDLARRISHDLGLRPYRVFLVWEARDINQRFNVFRRIELFPVTITNLNDVDLALSAVGLDGDGFLKITRISPVQVTRDDLRGRIDMKNLDLAPSPDDRRFYYEIVRMMRCGSESSEFRGRYAVAAEPYLNANRYQWEVMVVDQIQARNALGEDRTFVPDNKIPDIAGKVTRLRR